jgi:hypothetical protein
VPQAAWHGVGCFGNPPRGESFFPPSKKEARRKAAKPRTHKTR